MRPPARSILRSLSSALTLLLYSVALHAQILSLVEVHEDNESPETNGSPTVQTHLDGPDAFGVGFGLAISADGNHVYVTSFLDSALTVLSRDSGTGALTLVEIHEDNESPEAGGSPTAQTHLELAVGVAISADGNNVYVTSVADDAVTVFSRNSGTGALTLVEVHEDNASPETGGSPITQTHLDEARGVAISDDGNHVYVTSGVDDAVTVFSRDSGTGALTLVEVHEDNASPETGGSPIAQTHLDPALGVAVSADGNNVYVTSDGDDAVTVFSRDSGTGSLTLVEVHEDNESPEAGGSPIEQTHLDTAIGVAVSADDNHVFVTSAIDDALTVFSRDSGTGALTLVEVHEDNESPEVGGSPTAQTHLDGSRSIAAADSHVLVSSGDDYAVTVFSRDSGTGALTLVEVHEDNNSPEAGGSPIAQTHLEVVSIVAISPDGEHVYATGATDDAVTVFAASPTVPVELTTFSISDLAIGRLE